MSLLCHHGYPMYCLYVYTVLVQLDEYSCFASVGCPWKFSRKFWRNCALRRCWHTLRNLVNNVHVLKISLVPGVIIYQSLVRGQIPTAVVAAPVPASNSLRHTPIKPGVLCQARAFAHFAVCVESKICGIASVSCGETYVEEACRHRTKVGNLAHLYILKHVTGTTYSNFRKSFKKNHPFGSIISL